MEIKKTLSLILDELKSTCAGLKEAELQELENRILKANRIYVAGAGRSLMDIGLNAYVVGETVTPAIEKGDFLIIASGSGETKTLTVIAQKCKSMDIPFGLITTDPDSTIGALADCIVCVNAASPKLANEKHSSIQPGGNTFEQSVLLIGDALIIDMTSNKSLHESNIELMKRHANLE